MEMEEKPQKQHEWLRKLIGKWTYEAEHPMGPDKQAVKLTGTEEVHAIGDLWIVAEAEGDLPDGRTGQSLMLVGFDAQENRFVGSWVGSTMTRQWIYEGELDPAERMLTLSSEGPDFVNVGRVAPYRDVIEFLSDDHRTLSGHVQGSDGEWTKFMTTHYRRSR